MHRQQCPRVPKRKPQAPVLVTQRHLLGLSNLNLHHKPAPKSDGTTELIQWRMWQEWLLQDLLARSRNSSTNLHLNLFKVLNFNLGDRHCNDIYFIPFCKDSQSLITHFQHKMKNSGVEDVITWCKTKAAIISILSIGEWHLDRKKLLLLWLNLQENLETSNPSKLARKG